MALFNAYVNGRDNAGVENTPIASLTSGDATGGATLQQTVLGLEYDSPRTVFGAKVSGALYADFFGGTESSLNHEVRLRTATISLDWGRDQRDGGTGQADHFAARPELVCAGSGIAADRRREFMVVAATGESGAAHQIRRSRRVAGAGGFDRNARVGRGGQWLPPVCRDGAGGGSGGARRSGRRGRFEFWRQWGEGTRIEIAPGFHENASHAGGASVPTEIFSIDWLIKPVKHVEFSGFFYNGQNVAVLGALPAGIRGGL